MNIKFTRLILPLTVLALFFYSHTANAAVKTWTAQTTGFWTNPANWSGNSVPTSLDEVLFDGTGQGACTFANNSAIAGFTMTAAYTGSFIVSGPRVMVVNGNFVQNGGTFISTSNTTSGFSIVGGNFIRTGGTFNHNNGLINVRVVNGIPSQMSGTTTFNRLQIEANGAAGERFIDFGSGITTASLNLNGTTRQFSYQGQITINTRLNILGTSIVAPTANTGTFIMAPGSTMQVPGTANTNPIPNLLVNSNLTIIGSQFSASGNVTVQPGVAFTVPNGCTYRTLGDLTVGAGGSVSFPATSPVEIGGVLTVNLTSSVTFPSTSSVAIGGDAIIDGTVTLPSASTITIDGNFYVNGTITNPTTSNVELGPSSAEFVINTQLTLSRLFFEQNNVIVYSTAGSVTLTINDELGANTANVLFDEGSVTVNLPENSRVSDLTGSFLLDFSANAATVRVVTGAPAGRITDWTMLGVSGVRLQTLNDWDGKIPMSCNDCIHKPASVGSFTSVQRWDAPTCTFDGNTSVQDSLTPGLGLWVYRGKSAPSTSGPAFNWAVSGPLVQGQVRVPVTAGVCTDGEFVLVANPYASPLDWEKVWLDVSNLNVGSIYQVYDPNTSSFLEYDADDQVGTASPIIAKGQGFYIDGSSTAEIVFEEAHKATTITPLVRSGSSEKKNYFTLHLKGSGETDRTRIKIRDGASLGKDRYESFKYQLLPIYWGMTTPWDEFTSISTRDAEGNDYSVQAIPFMRKDMSIPVMVHVLASGMFTITASDFEGYSSCIILKDRYNGNYYDLKKAPLVVQLSDTMTVPRFELVVCSTDSGPVTSVGELNASNWVNIVRNGDNAVVNTEFAKNTESRITVMNILGQQLMQDILVNGTDNETVVNLEGFKDQIILIRVASDRGTVTKKMALN